MKKYSDEARELLSNIEQYEVKAGGEKDTTIIVSPDICTTLCTSCTVCSSECTACVGCVMCSSTFNS